MQYEIIHTTSYRFSGPASLEPHEVRLTPRSDAAQRVIDFDFSVWPTPLGTASLLDMEGNACTSIWWDGATCNELTIESRATIETLRCNPFGFLLVRDAAHLPVRYSDDALPILQSARARPTSPDSFAAEIDALVCQLRRETRDQTIPFLAELNRYLNCNVRVVHRSEGPPKPAATTWTEREGACRDLAALFMDACRTAGLAARFVSGYHEGDSDSKPKDLHAWAEVYLPGGGWRGFDPTIGLAVSDRHVAVAASAHPKNAAPITGAFVGNGITTEMTYSIRMIRAGVS